MITLELVTLDGLKFSGDVHEVIMPTPDGLIAIFPDHMPLVSLATPGIISVRRRQGDRDDAMEHFATNGGVVEVSDNRVRVLVDEADEPESISEKAVQEALQRAMTLAHEAKDQVSLDKAHQIIQHRRSQLKVAGLRRRKNR